MQNPLTKTLAACLTTALAAAQTTYVVDAQNGPGTNFLDLPPALAAAVHGDAIIVRAAASYYQGGKTNQGIRIVGTGGRPRIETFEVDGLPAGEAFALTGVEVFFTAFMNGPETLKLANNAGVVAIEDVRTTGGPYLSSGLSAYGRALVQDCAQVAFTRCHFDGGLPALQVIRSTVSLSGCTVDGYDWGEIRFSPTTPGPALEADSATLLLADTDLNGGDGWWGHTGPAGPSSLPWPGAPGARLQDTDIVFAGELSSLVTAGAAPQQFPAAALEVTRGSALLTGASLRANGGAAALSGTTTLRQGFVPALTGRPARVGQAVVADLFGEAGATAVFLVGAPAPVIPFAAGRLWLDPTRALATAPATVGAGRWLRFSVPLPYSTPYSVPFVLQAATLSTTGTLALSNPVAQLTLF